MAEKQARTGTGVGPEAFAGRRATRAQPCEGELHVCPACTSQLVFPTDWAPARRRQWIVALRCPDCEWHGEGVFAQDVVDRFDEALDAGTEQLLEDLNLLARANMEEQVDRFVAALEAGHVVPDDF